MSESKAGIIEKNKKFVCPDKIRIFNEIGIDLVIGKREGPYIYDVDGKRLIDLHINGGTFTLGHRPPEILKALHEAATHSGPNRPPVPKQIGRSFRSKSATPLKSEETLDN